MLGESNVRKDWARDAQAFDTVYRENAPRLRAFIRQIVGSFQAAEDLTQEIFTQLWRQPDRFDPTRGSLRAYLFGIGKPSPRHPCRTTDVPPAISSAAPSSPTLSVAFRKSNAPCSGYARSKASLMPNSPSFSTFPWARFGPDCLWPGKPCEPSG